MTVSELDVLLVEDNQDDEILARRAIRRAAKEIEIKIEIARDGVEALEYIFGRGAGQAAQPVNVPKLILLDVKLPRLSGFEVLKQIRGNANTRHIPVVMLTASSERRDIIEAYEIGANSYIRKPVDFAEFGEIVKYICTYWLTMNHAAPLRVEG